MNNAMYSTRQEKKHKIVTCTHPQHGAVAGGALVPHEVPARETQRNSQLTKGQDELAGPEVAEDHVQKGVLGVRGELELSVRIREGCAVVLVCGGHGGDGAAGGQLREKEKSEH